VTSGTTAIEKDARVDGDVIMTSGDLRVDGEIDGDVFLTSGTIRIGADGVIRGDVVWTSGQIDEEEGARIEGSVPVDSDASSYGDIAGFFVGFFLVPLIIFFAVIILLIVLIVVLIKRRGATRKAQAQLSEPVEQIKLLKKQFDEGSITEEDYEARKKEILEKI
jgi:uncharacterized membrane protein